MHSSHHFCRRFTCFILAACPIVGRPIALPIVEWLYTGPGSGALISPAHYSVLTHAVLHHLLGRHPHTDREAFACTEVLVQAHAAVRERMSRAPLLTECFPVIIHFHSRARAPRGAAGTRTAPLSTGKLRAAVAGEYGPCTRVSLLLRSRQNRGSHLQASRTLDCLHRRGLLATTDRWAQSRRNQLTTPQSRSPGYPPQSLNSPRPSLSFSAPTMVSQAGRQEDSQDMLQTVSR
jgi:hypothetical protein